MSLSVSLYILLWPCCYTSGVSDQWQDIDNNYSEFILTIELTFLGDSCFISEQVFKATLSNDLADRVQLYAEEQRG